MWAYESVFYQIYPMGFCGVPFENDGIQRHEIKRVEEWIPHMQKLGVNAVYFSRYLNRIPMVTIPGIIVRLM